MTKNAPKSKVLEKGLWVLALPMIFEQLIIFSLPMADTFFLSRLSDHSAAAVGAITPVVYLCNVMLIMLSVGGASVAGQLIGAGRYKHGNSALVVLACVTVIMAVVAMLGIRFLGPAITSMMGLPPEIKAEADQYLSVICFLILAFGGRRVYSTIINVYGHPKWNLLSSLLMTGLNVGLNAMVVFVWHGGIRGIALASVFSAVAALLIQVVATHGRLNLKMPIAYALRRFKTIFKSIWRISFPCSIEPLSFNLNMIVLNMFVARLGAEALAARTYTFNIFILGMVLTIALGTANQSIIAQLIGKRDFDEADRQLKKSLRAASLGAAAVVFILFTAHRPLMGLFTNNPEVLQWALVLFALAALTEVPRAINIMVGGSLRATGDAWYITIISMVVTWFFAIPLAYILTFKAGWGLAGIFTSALTDELLRSILNLQRWNQKKWHRYGVVTVRKADVAAG
jgi:putative MATE family efflux protein